ncbi:MAG: glycosyltransferase [Phormidesmis sp.]
MALSSDGFRLDRLRLGRSRQWPTYLNALVFLLIALLGLLGLVTFRDPARLEELGWSGLVSIGVLGIWRWSWLGMHLLRSAIYQHAVFPRWRRQANAIPLDQLPHVCLLVPTYKEKPWITQRVFRAVALEAKTLGQPITLVTVSSGPEEDAAIVEALRLGDPTLAHVRVVHAVDPGSGKRGALASGLRHIAELDLLPEDSVVALMDGDSEFTPGTLRGSIPFFKTFPKLGALTTDEVPVVVGSYWFSEWFHLRFAQRHYQMCSVSLSRKVLCLTGRFSLYRSSAVLHPTFADQLENDTLNDWLWGKFKFLSGDDKTTWYWMLRRGNYDLLYLPDVKVYSIESISGSLPMRVYQNMRRWFGNMLRNGSRALALGPRRLGWFVMLCLIDQRISMWTSLVAPTIVLIAIATLQWPIVALLISWIILTRSVMLLIIFSGRPSALKPIHLPILLFSQWFSALVKIWTQMNLAQQRWFNRGDRKLSVEGDLWVQRLTKNTSRFLIWAQTAAFVVLILSLLGLVSPATNLSDWWQGRSVVGAEPAQMVIVADLTSDDDKDDAAALQDILEGLPATGLVEIVLPVGELHFDSPIRMDRSYTILSGQGVDRTVLTSRLQSEPDTRQTEDAAAIIVSPPAAGSADSDVVLQPEEGQLQTDQLENVQLRGFTVRPLPALEERPSRDGIRLTHVMGATLERLKIEAGGDRAIVLNETENVELRYIRADSYPEKKRLVEIKKN